MTFKAIFFLCIAIYGYICYVWSFQLIQLISKPHLILIFSTNTDCESVILLTLEVLSRGVRKVTTGIIVVMTGNGLTLIWINASGATILTNFNYNDPKANNPNCIPNLYAISKNTVQQF